ncbi:MAG: class C sortase [Clostridiales bacterium]|nr:class C sortase [Clostridiales bacterium]
MKQKNSLTTILLVIVLLAGLSLLLYPSVSDYWNSFHQSQVIAQYAEQLVDLDQERYAGLMDEARAYNASLVGRRNDYLLTDAQKVAYEELLNVSGVGAMGYIEIPAINCTLPIYHGTAPAVLQIAIGHLEWTSLPVGGEGTHCVLSGHRGLPSAKLFSDLDKLVVGDLFMLRILDEILTYEVDQILIVEPHETKSLLIEEGKDYCTLVTCTPYGINTHRLLVRGHRVENVAQAKKIRITSDAMQIEPLLIAPIVAAPMLLILLIMVMLPQKPKHHYRRDDRYDEID